MDNHHQDASFTQQNHSGRDSFDSSANFLISGCLFQKKYSTLNPILRLMVRNFFRELRETSDMTEGKLLDVGSTGGQIDS